jgi:hypothetical protein
MFSTLVLWKLLSMGTSVELDRVWPSFMHEFFWIQSIGIIPLEQFQEVLPTYVYKRCQSKFRKTWHSLTFEAFFDYMYKVSQTLFLLILLLYFTSCLLLGSIFHMPWSLNFFCSMRSQLLEMLLRRCIMKSSLCKLIAPPSSLKSRWRRQWIKKDH